MLRLGMKRFSHLNPELKPLVEGETPTAEIPKVNWIEVTSEEYKRMFPPWEPPPLLTIEDVE
jgi:hypothetical protein